MPRMIEVQNTGPGTISMMYIQRPFDAVKYCPLHESEVRKIKPSTRTLVETRAQDS